jgi:hypothetical protein
MYPRLASLHAVSKRRHSTSFPQGPADGASQRVAPGNCVVHAPLMSLSSEIFAASGRLGNKNLSDVSLDACAVCDDGCARDSPCEP